MKPTESAEAFAKFCAQNGVHLSLSLPREGIEQMIAFFVTIKPEGCDPNDGDMLLYQWGTYDWGQGKHFELDITRQFVEQEREDDDAISQLNITYKFEPTAQLEALGAGNRWCEGPAEIETMRAYIFSSSPYITVVDCKAIRVDVTYSYV